jgi:hypothetical protein
MSTRRDGSSTAVPSLLFYLLCLAAASGCADDADLAEAIFTARDDETSARVWIPVNEPRSVGTYRGEVVWSDGSTLLLEAERDGMISDVWLADLTGNGSPELVVASQSAGSGSYGSVDVYRRSGDAMLRLEISPLKREQREGYMGHDSFLVERDTLYRSYPVYLEGDPNAGPTGGRARLRYSFAEGLWVPARQRPEDALRAQQ